MATAFRPGTFSTTKARGRSWPTSWANRSTSVLRGSKASRLPIALKPWHGGPPKTTAMSSVPACVRTASAVKSATDAHRETPPGKLRAWVATAAPSKSTARRTSKPAISKPRDMPPAPPNRSTATGRAVEVGRFIGRRSHRRPVRHRSRSEQRPQSGRTGRHTSRPWTSRPMCSPLLTPAGTSGGRSAWAW